MSDEQVSGGTREDELDLLALLGDDTRRAVYFAVRDADGALTRKDVAGQLGISVHLAAFHLEKLLEGGWLTAYYQRPPGRGGPGAGRSAKYYEPADIEVAVTIPPRSYQRLSGMLVEAVTSQGEGETGEDAAVRVAREHGYDDGSRVRRAHRLRRPGRARTLDLVAQFLEEQGYEPYRVAGAIGLGNCPFRGLAVEAPELVCTANHAYLEGLIHGVGGAALPAVLACRRQGDCCVMLGDIDA